MSDLLSELYAALDHWTGLHRSADAAYGWHDDLTVFYAAKCQSVCDAISNLRLLSQSTN